MNLALTGGHSTRVSRYAVKTAVQLGYTGDRLEHIRLGGELHDIGKIRSPRRRGSSPVVDAFDAMTTNRTYRPSRIPPDATEELRRCAGSHFDSEVVEAFLRAFSDVSALPLRI